MAKQIEGVYEMVLACAQAEFVEKGFGEASLRTIAQNAGTSTSSIYTRFGDKAGLFAAVVEPAVVSMKRWFTRQQEDFHSLPVDYQREHSFDHSSRYVLKLVDRVYEHFDLFRLLVSGASGTEYAALINDIAEIDTDYTLKFIEITGSDVLETGRASPRLLHMLATAYYSAFFEIVEHDMPREEAYRYVNQLRRFFVRGWEDIFVGGDDT